MILLESIQSISCFKNLSAQEIELLSSFSSVTKYNNKSILYYENEVKNSVMFLVNGLVKIYKFDKFNNEIFLYNIYKNSMINDLNSQASNDIYCFSNASFVEDSTVLSINYERLQKHFLSKSILTKEFMEILMQKTHQLQLILNRELVFDATAKVASMLFYDLKMFNSLKRQDVSLMLHIRPETLSRVLKKLLTENTIEILNNQINVINFDALNFIFKESRLKIKS